MSGFAVAMLNVTKSYEDWLALTLDTLEIRFGECIWISGPNGAGKSTLLHIMAGLTKFDDGHVGVCDAPPGSLDARRSVSFVPDSPALYEDLSVLEQCEYVAGLHGVDDGEELVAERVLNAFGLSSRRDDPPRFLSRGMKQKLSLALGFVRPFRLILLDEPFEGLDAAGERALVRAIDEALARSAAVVVAGHRLPADLRRRARVLELQDGHITS